MVARRINVVILFLCRSQHHVMVILHILLRGSFAVLTWLLSSLEARYPLDQDRSSYHACTVVLGNKCLTEVTKNTVLTAVPIGTCEREPYA